LPVSVATPRYQAIEKHGEQIVNNREAAVISIINPTTSDDGRFAAQQNLQPDFRSGSRASIPALRPKVCFARQKPTSNGSHLCHWYETNSHEFTPPKGSDSRAANLPTS
jgi:hypothetical protein